MAHPRLKHFTYHGKMGTLIATFDWAKTPLGDPAEWPPGLLTVIGIMIDNTIPMCLMWGKDRIQIYNDAYVPIQGNKHPKALGRPVLESWPEVAEASTDITSEALNGRTVHAEDTPFLVSIDGKLQQRYYTFSCAPLRLDDGEIRGVLLTSLDTTEQVRGRKILEENVKNFRKYQEQSPIPFLSMTEDWIVDYMNPAGLNEAVLRVTKEKVANSSFYELWPLARNSAFEDNYKRAMKGEKVDFEAVYENRWYRVFAFPLDPGIGIFFQDVTGAKKLQHELEKAVESRDRFLSIASHELNTPLTSLKLHTQMMERMLPKGVAPDRLQKFFEQTDLQVARLGQLVGDMLDASRIREGRLSLRLVDTDLKKLVTESVERISPYYLASGVREPVLKVTGTDFHCDVDPGRIEQVICNLLTNAMKYGGGKPVTVTLREEGATVCITIHDDGPGILPEDQERIFDQYDRGAEEKGEGLGLGLFIARQIVLAHGGTISLESAKGAGSSFHVKLKKR